MTAWRESVAILLMAALLAACAAYWSAHAEPALNFPRQHHGWLHELRSPPNDLWSAGEKCCDPGDCWIVSYRIATPTREGMSGYFVRFGADELEVPMNRVTRPPENPTMQAVLCVDVRRSPIYIYCFIPGPEG